MQKWKVITLIFIMALSVIILPQPHAVAASQTVLVQYNDPRDLPSLPGSFDMSNITVTLETINNIEYLVFKVKYFDIMLKDVVYAIQIYIDADGDVNTGYPDCYVQGADYLIEVMVFGDQAHSVLKKWIGEWSPIYSPETKLGKNYVKIFVKRVLIEELNLDLFGIKVRAEALVQDDVEGEPKPMWLIYSRNIVVNGIRRDWFNINPMWTDGKDVSNGIPEEFDVSRIFLAINDTNFFIRIDTWEVPFIPVDPTTSLGKGCGILRAFGKVLVDADINVNTGENIGAMGVDYEIMLFHSLENPNGTILSFANATIIKWSEMGGIWDPNTAKTYLFEYLPRETFEWSVLLSDMELRRGKNIMVAFKSFANFDTKKVTALIYDTAPLDYFFCPPPEEEDPNGWIRPVFIAEMDITVLVLNTALEEIPLPVIEGADIYAVLLDGTVVAQNSTDERGIANLKIEGLAPGTNVRLVACFNGWMDNNLLLEFEPGRFMFTYEYTPTPQAASLKMSSGWNLISLPVSPPSNSLADVFGAYTNKVVYATTYDPRIPDYVDYINGTDDPTAYTLEPCLAYLVYVETEEPLILNIEGGMLCGLSYAAACGHTVPLVPGWNFVGVPASGPVTPEEWLSGYDWDIICGLQPGVGTVCKIRGVNGGLTELEPGHGYWVHIRG